MCSPILASEPAPHRLVADALIVFHDAHALQRHQPRVGVAVNHLAAHDRDLAAAGGAGRASGGGRGSCSGRSGAAAAGGRLGGGDSAQRRLQLAIQRADLLRELRRGVTGSLSRQPAVCCLLAAAAALIAAQLRSALLRRWRELKRAPLCSCPGPPSPCRRWPACRRCPAPGCCSVGPSGGGSGEAWGRPTAGAAREQRPERFGASAARPPIAGRPSPERHTCSLSISACSSRLAPPGLAVDMATGLGSRSCCFDLG